jgi:hypothetical protein
LTHHFPHDLDNCAGLFEWRQELANQRPASTVLDRCKH